ncbi:alpha/beta hydrolase [Pigmentiphaga litoralis]|uniref:alpha/beta fold hydrolase n=1 Tax=Pigmentiphaga litoralis TaxID=516702 RepID=UPI00167AB095|nr:alpha/beta hydrolase [Pigmentiphaga litoralis]GGX17629.1 alpha/beta hydrolase [Pigmentiphaga litoralis]
MSRLRYGAHVHANGIRQHYLRFGDGPPLIVIPGITSPAATWAFVGERLGASFDTYVLDVRGRGLSEAGPGLSYSLDTYADDVKAFAAALNLDSFYLIGHSMGGRIAARTAHRGGSIQRMVLADPPLSGPGRRPYVLGLSFYLDTLRKAQAGLLSAEQVRLSYPRWSDAQCQTRAEWLHTCDITAITETHRGFQEDDIHGDIAALAMPTLLMVAGIGNVITPDELAEVQGLQPELAVAHLPQASHMIPFDDLERFAHVTEGFLLQEAS